MELDNNNEYVTAVCQCCKLPLDVKHQPRMRTGDPRAPLLQLECKQPDCLLFEKTCFINNYVDYLETDYIAKWSVKAS